MFYYDVIFNTAFYYIFNTQYLIMYIFSDSVYLYLLDFKCGKSNDSVYFLYFNHEWDFALEPIHDQLTI